MAWRIAARTGRATVAAPLVVALRRVLGVALCVLAAPLLSGPAAGVTAGAAMPAGTAVAMVARVPTRRPFEELARVKQVVDRG